MKTVNLLFVALAFVGFSCTKPISLVEFVCTTEKNQWENLQTILAQEKTKGHIDIVIDTELPQQRIEGFGSCFNEFGWLSLILLDENDRESVMKELFAKDEGANFTVCRTPIGANDFSRDWYSYNETDQDFEMNNFSIDTDREMLIHFIKNALKYNPDLKIWASPWSPPSWMKHNKHYASRSIHTPEIDNGLPENRQGYEGTDMFICEDEYLKAYALYFAKYIDAYRQEGINIFAVMPQNEFNSAQVFPSCCWTAGSLADFIGKYLGPAMEERGVDVMFGTMERPNEALVDTVLNDPESGKYIKGVGFQWAGKDAIAGIHKRYRKLPLYQTEQECGDGSNNWEGALYSWNLMKHYINNGVSAYMYWNTSLPYQAPSRWGWKQNSLVVVKQVGDTDKFTYEYTPEYYIMKHLSHYVKPGAIKLLISSKDMLAFLNPDKSIVIIAENPEEENKIVKIAIKGTTFYPMFKANSISTMLFK